MTVTAVSDPPNTWVDMQKAMRDRHVNNDERLGQACFNALAAAWPEVAELVRGTSADPFYAETSHDPRMRAFFETVGPYFI